MTNVTANGIKIHCRIEGPPEGPVLVLSHALGTNLQMWESQMEALTARGRVLRYDGRGHGKSDAPPGPYTTEQLSEDVIALMDALDIATASICGISLGGQVALWLAARHPERFERAVFASTAATIGPPDMWDSRIELVRSGGISAATDVYIDRMFSKDFQRSRPELVREAVGWFESTSPEGYVASCLAIRDADLRDEVRSIGVPSLILSAENDAATPPTDGQWLHEHIAGSRMVVLEHAAHLSNVEEPNRFTTALLDFLDPPA